MEMTETVTNFDPNDLEGEQDAFSLEKESILEQDSTPVLPHIEPSQSEEKQERELMRFHLGMAPPDEGPLRPAVFSDLRKPDFFWRDYPLVLQENKAGGLDAVSLGELLTGCLAAAGDTPIITANLAYLVATADRLLAGRCSRLNDIMARAFDHFPEELDLSTAGRTSLTEELDRLKAVIPGQGLVLGLGRHTGFTLFLESLAARRAPRQNAFLAELKELITGLEDLLRVEHAQSGDAQSPQALSAALGQVGGSFFKTENLAQTLPESRGSVPFSPERDERIKKSLFVLKAFMDQAKTEPGFYVVHDGALPEGFDLPRGAEIREADALRSACTLFEQRAGEMSAVFRAVRVARLELAEEYNPDLHEQALERFNWKSCTGDEISLLPAVVVLEQAERVRAELLSSFSHLLCSNLPLHLILWENALASEDSAFRVYQDLGYLAVCHREALVIKSSLGYPKHLLDGFQRMAAGGQTALALVAVPPWQGELPSRVYTAVAIEGRATPLFRYEPLAGDSWASRFALDGNPQPETIWPVHPFSCSRDGKEFTLELPFSFADAAALDSGFRNHFRVIPPSSWRENQVTFSEFMAAGEGREIPYIWVLDEENHLQRALVGRELAMACLDRSRLWRIYQELGGIHNEYARRAEETARKETRKEADETIKGLEQAHASEVEKVRSEAGRETMERLARVLLDLDAGALSFGSPAPGITTAAPVPVLPVGPSAEPRAEAPPPEAVEEEEEEELTEDPFIDTDMCTSCDECTNINPIMFKYNGEKQAYLADVTAGTFAQLVLAAEVCPARIIHPGVPRKDDGSATAELLERAAKFN